MGQFIGPFFPSEILEFVVGGNQIGFTVTNFDLWKKDSAGSGWSRLLSNEAVTALASGPVGYVRPTNGLALLSVVWLRGEKGMVVLKDTANDSPNDTFILRFEISHLAKVIEGLELIDLEETIDAVAEAAPNSLIGRLYTLERNQIDNISPKLRRLLGYASENHVIDGIFFDDASNTVECRQRVFDTALNARAAVRWIDVENESDPAPPFPGTGELSRQKILAAHNNQRQIRVQLLGSIDVADGGSGDLPDQAFDESSVI